MTLLNLLAITVTFITVLHRTTNATPSVFACPLGVSPFGQGGFGGGFGGALGGGLGGMGGMNGAEICDRGSFIHYYACCDENPFRCCFEFETWAIVIFAMILVAIVGGIVFALGRYFCANY